MSLCSQHCQVYCVYCQLADLAGVGAQGTSVACEQILTLIFHRFEGGGEGTGGGNV